MTLTPGTHLGPYEILSPIGAGGMGEVYRAKDTRLKRDVAIKVLPERLAKNPEALNRFEREAQAVAALSHPNILAIYDVGTEGETSYVVMELLEGETLRDRVRRSAVPWRKASEYGAAIAEGLAAAHAKGIIHRDLKPENIFLTKDGVVKILDFGLAHVEAASGAPSANQADTPTITLDTRPGTILGTINYMSPEQVRGQRTDARSDIFSFGCVLYEMVTGHRAFTGDTSADLMTAILKEEPPSVATSLTGIGPELDRTVTRCLEKDAQQRFQSSGDLSFTLRNILSASGHVVPSSGTTAPRNIRLLWASAAVMVIIGGGFFAYRDTWTRQGGRVDAIDSLAILPFVIAGGDPRAEYLGEEIPATIIDSISQLPGLRVVPRSTVFRLARDGTDHRQIAKELRVRAILSGEVSQRGERLSVRVALVDARSDRQLWGERYDRTEDDILAIEKDIAKRICEALRVRLTGEQKTELVRSYTDNTQAYRTYKEARFWWNKRTQVGFKRAIELYDKAIRIDPGYALAYAGKADCYCSAAWFFRSAREVAPKAMEAVDAALALDPQLPEAYPPRAWVRAFIDWDWAGAERDFRRAIKLNPDYATAHHWYSIFLAAQGRLDEAQREIRRARELDPGSLVINRDLGLPYFARRQYDRAIEQFRNTLGMDPTFTHARVALAWALKANHQYDEAIAEIQRVYEEVGRIPRAAGWLGAIHAAAGHFEQARQELRTLTALSGQQYVPAVAFALIHAELGEYDAAFARMDEAFEARDESLMLLAVSPWFDALRRDPRFDELLRRVGLEGVLPTRPAPPLAVKSKTGRINLIVLPFEDISPAPEAWFGDGLTETLIAQLSRLSPGRLSVIASTTAMQYKGTDKPVRRIARELNIDYVVEGRVQRIDDRVRISARLVRASDETLVWSEQFDRKIDDVFALQSEVVGRIAEGIQIQLTPTEEAQLARVRPIDPDALDAYLQGIALAKDGTRQACRSALKMFDQAIEVDPSFALAHVGRANVFVTLGEWHMPPLEAMPHAKTAALDALALDEGLPEALTALAYVQMEFEWDFPSAEKTFRRAVELNGSSTDARLGYAVFLTATKRGDEAVRQLDWVREHDPASVYTYEHHGMVAFMARRFDRVIRDCSAAIDVDEEFWKARSWLGMAHAQRGEFAEAIHHLSKALRQSDESPVVAAMLGSVLAVSGRREEARVIVERLKEREESDYVCPYELATVWIGLDDHDEAFEEMDRACDDRAACMPWLQVDPRLDPIRSDPRFDRLVRRVGFEQDGKLGLADAEEPDQPERIMLAVLPFEDMSPEPQEWFSDGMTEEMIAQLGRLCPDKLGVIARTSAMHYKSSTKTANQIGRELRVDYLVEGSVRRAEERVRVTAQLIDVSDQTHLWADSYEGDLADVFGIQAEVAQQIVRALALKLLPNEETPLDRAPRVGVSAYDLYLKGRFAWNKFSPAAFKEALGYFRQAIEQDPNYAAAYAGVADSHAGLALFGAIRPKEAFPKAEVAARKALELDDTIVESHLSLAAIRALYDWDWEAAEAGFERAFELQPNNATAHHWYAVVYLVRVGKLEEALQQIKRAQELDPHSLLIKDATAWVYWLDRQYDRAIEMAEEKLALEPAAERGHRGLAGLYVQKDMFEEAVAAYEETIALEGRTPGRLYSLGHALAKSGRRDEALAIVDELTSWSDQTYISPLHVAHIYIAIGEVDEAFMWLEQAYEDRCTQLSLLAVAPVYDPLRRDPRFDDLLRRIGLEPSSIPVEQTPGR